MHPSWGEKRSGELIFHEPQIHRGEPKVKRVHALFLAAAMVIAAGCGGGSQSSNAPSNACPSSNAEKQIKIGFIGPLSGDVKTYGLSALKGFNLALEQAGCQAGDLGIVAVVDDDRGDVNEGQNVFTKQVSQNGVKAIVGAVTSNVTVPLSVKANDQKIVMITGTATADNVTVDDSGNRKPFVFRAAFADSYQGTAAAKFAVEKLGAKKAAVVYDKSNDYTVGLSQSFRTEFEAQGGEIVSFESYGKDDTDFSAIMTKVAAANPDVLYIPDYYNKASLIGQAARTKGVQAAMIGADGWDSTELNFEVMQGGYFTAHYSSDDPAEAVQQFVKDYQAKYGERPDSFAALGYDATNLLLEAIREAKTDDPEQIRQALQNLKDFPAVGGNLSFDEKGNPVKGATILQVNADGTYSFVTKMEP